MISGSKVLERPPRNSRLFEHRSNKNEDSDDSIIKHSNRHFPSDSKSPLVSMSSRTGKAKISEMYDQEEKRHFRHELTEFIQNMLDDVKILMNLAGSIFTNLKDSLIKDSEGDCSDCLSLLRTNSHDYEETQEFISDFLKHGTATVDRFVKEPSHHWYNMNEVIRSEDTDLNIVDCVTRVKRRLYKLLALVRECASSREDDESLSIADSIKDFISEFDMRKFKNLDELMTYKSGHSSGRSMISDVSSGASSTRFTGRNYRAFPRSTDLRSSGIYGVDDNDANISKTATVEIEAFEILLNFLRSVPTVLSEILRLINTSCSVKSMADEHENHKVASKMYSREGHRYNSHGTSAAHSASGYFVGNPKNVHSSESTTSSFPSDAHDARKQLFKSFNNKKSRISGMDDDLQKLNEFSFHDGDSSESSKKTTDPEHLQTRNRHANTAAAMSRPFLTFNGAVDAGSQEQEPTLGKAHRKFHDSRPHGSSSLSTGSSADFAFKKMFLPNFPASPFPQCQYINNIRYEGPVTTYGEPQSFYFDPAAMNWNDFSLDDSDGDRSFGISRDFSLRVPIDQNLVLLGSDPIEFGDYIALDLDKCTLLSKLIEGSDTIDFQLLGSPLVFFKSNDPSIGSIWEIAAKNFIDVVGSKTFNSLRKKCHQISHSSTTRRNTIFRRSTAAERE